MRKRNQSGTSILYTGDGKQMFKKKWMTNFFVFYSISNTEMEIILSGGWSSGTLNQSRGRGGQNPIW